MSIKGDIQWRIGLVYLMMLLVGLLIVGKILYLQVFKASYYLDMAQEQSVKDITIEPNRGDIYASNDRLLAISVPYYEIRMDFRARGLTQKIFMSGVDSLSIRLSSLFHNKSNRDYRREMMAAWRKGERYYLIKRDVSYAQLKELKKFPIWRHGRNKGGFIYVQDNLRSKPHQNLASRTIGYLTKDTLGNVVGIEGAYDGYLKGVTGLRLMQKLSGGVWMPVNDGNEIEPRDGYDVVTTIDVNVQDVAETALRKQLEKNNAHHGCAVLMEVKTGDIKAIVNLEKDEDGQYRELYNYAIGESTEPGSTFKVPSLMAALEEKVIDLDDTVDTDHGKYKVYDKIIHDTEEKGYGKITVKQVLEVSSNVGVSKIIYENFKGREKDFIDRLYKMGLNKPLGIEIKGEVAPDIKYPGDKYWSGISLAMISHGYEIRLTPLQILAFYNAIANNGKMMKPRFVKEVRYRGNVIKRFNTEVLNSSICSGSTIRKTKEMLEGVVEQGTAKNLNNSIYKIAGKTGTAQIAQNKYGYRRSKGVSYQASFVGYFPADDPQYTCIVVVNSPSNWVYYGNVVAGPVFKEIADKVYATSLNMHEYFAAADTSLVVPFTKAGDAEELTEVLKHFDFDFVVPRPRPSWVSTSSRDTYVDLRPMNIQNRLVPNVVSMGLKDALFLLESAGMRVEVIGRGTVRKQSVAPGSLAHEGERIVLEMSFI
jgi:cell division protein FtsI (penicillin-binding protein 3)